ncbi:hypothetical protein NT6N_31210 [Oceaniferula spumae]|uniref:Fe/B12 periplasmic-binding domain-containing protein n=1 Tax=Oceaniferula spumae TaxID=2979115 RepID=A0AAT9FPX8_9BACT
MISQTIPWRFLLILVGVIALFAASYFVRQLAQPRADNATTTNSFHRIIALSPSAVEIIYQLGIEEDLVGVSRFCKHPPEASEKPVVGGYLDLDFEAVLRLKPDCVILLNEQHQIAERLEQLGIKTISVDHASTRGITDSITAFGAAFDRKEKAQALISNINSRVEKVTQRAKNLPTRPRVLVCIDRDTNSSQPDRVIAAGNAGVHQEYITLAGGVNAYQGSVAYPVVSREKLIELDPDIIIDLIQPDVWNKLGEAKLFSQWAAYSELKAVQNQRIIFVHENKHIIPGPRFTDTLDIFASAIQADTP